MLLLHPTKKVANIARIQLDESAANEKYQGILNEWYIDLASLGRPGKVVLLFVHRTTYITVIVTGRSLQKAIPVFLQRLQNLLSRNKLTKETIEKILLELHPVQFAKTSDRKTLAIINQYKYNLCDLFYYRFNIDTFSDWDLLEDEFMDYLHEP